MCGWYTISGGLLKSILTILLVLMLLKVGRDVSYSQVWWPILVLCIYPSKCIHTHPEQWAAIYAAVLPGEQLGVRCLAQGHLVVVLKVERVLNIHSHHLQSLPDRDSNSQPFDYESDSLLLGHDIPSPTTEGTFIFKTLMSTWIYDFYCTHAISEPH